MATPNYGYEKRQRELAKKQKKEEKARQKAARRHGDAPAGGDEAPQEGVPGSSDGAADAGSSD